MIQKKYWLSNLYLKNFNNAYSDTGNLNYIEGYDSKVFDYDYIQINDAGNLSLGNSGLSDSYFQYSSSNFLRLYVQSNELFRAYTDRFQFQDTVRLSDNNWFEFGNSGQGTDGAIRWTSSSSKLDFNVGGDTALRIGANNEVTVTNFTGSGNDYVCVDAGGTLFRSNTAC